LGAAFAGLVLSALPSVAPAQEVAFSAPGASQELLQSLRGASLVLSAVAESPVVAGDVVAAARAEYGRLLGALYGAGHYSGVISVRLDGREVANIPVLEDPAVVRRVDIVVEPGPLFRFSRAEITPLAPGTELPEGFALGQPAASRLVEEAAGAAVDGWRDIGHALAAPVAQEITADHARAALSAGIALAPGPRLRFGPLSIRGNQAVRTERVRAIAGLPEGEVFSPGDLRRSAERLRRTGAFRSVTLREADRPGPGDLLPIEVLVEEELPRRFGFGAELSSDEGLRLTSFWLHRNLLGGAERLRIGGEISGIGGASGGADYLLDVTYSRPATFTPDTSLTLGFQAERAFETDYDLTAFEVSGGLTHVFSETLTGSAAIAYRFSRVRDDFDTDDFQTLTLPLGLIWERRNDPLNPTDGFFLQGEAMPFLGFDSAGSGVRVTLDARGYQGFADDRFVAAARVQLGSIYGPSFLQTPRDFLFFSGGGGTVRGQEYQSLGVSVLRGGTVQTGGQHFIGLQSELRARVTDTIGVVAFHDVGFVAAEDWGDDLGGWHSGAGLGLRYLTPIGPIRFDVAVPVRGGDDGVQLYLGIGQAF
jgi:translocation and assembly module TamA